MNLRITIKRDTLTPAIRTLYSALSGAKRADMNRVVGAEVQKVTYDHISRLESSYAKASQRQGAPHTGFFAQAAEKVAQDSALSATDKEAVLTIKHPGFTRAFHSVKIVPRTARALAIPIHRDAYGHRAAALWDRMNLFIPKGMGIIAAMRGVVLTPMYVLCGSVTQKQDRTLLPTDEQWRDAGARGVKGYMRSIMTAGGNQ